MNFQTNAQNHFVKIDVTKNIVRWNNSYPKYALGMVILMQSDVLSSFETPYPYQTIHSMKN